MSNQGDMPGQSEKAAYQDACLEVKRLRCQGLDEPVRVLQFASLDSTSAYLRRQFGESGRPPSPWTVVVADNQTAGYGRQGRSWESDSSGLYASVALPAEEAGPLLTLLAGVAAIRACRAVSGAQGLGLKWVNDLVFAGPHIGYPLLGRPSALKFGGILAEGVSRGWVVLGIGINMAPVTRLEGATSLQEVGGCKPNRDVLLQTFLEHLACDLRHWQKFGNAAVRKAWLSESITIGNEVRVTTARESFEGRATDIDSDGRLVVLLGDGTTRSVASGTVRLANGNFA